MNKILFFLTLLFIPCFANAQNDVKGDTLFVADDIPEGDISHLLDFLDVQFYKLTISSASSIAHPKAVLIEKVEGGKIARDTVSFEDILAYGRGGDGDTSYPLLGLGQVSKIGDGKATLKVSFHFPSFRQNATRELRVDVEKAKDYVFFSVAHAYPKFQRGSFTPLFVFIPPLYMENGFGSYCAINYSNIPPIEWKTKFGLDNYIIYSFLFDRVE
ncbi:MAG: hypothetical protein Q3998_00565 [Porphyromonas sp.]|nr:hypothetical protein [Porphyromonas sp.]